MKYWFKAKKFGYGWTPCSIEGWTVFILAILGVLYVSFEYPGTPRFFIDVILIVAALIYIAYKKGEKIKWPWTK